MIPTSQRVWAYSLAAIALLVVVVVTGSAVVQAWLA